MELKFCSEREQKKIQEYGEYLEYSERRKNHSQRFRKKQISQLVINNKLVIRAGDTVHLKNKNGSYRVVAMSGKTVAISCQKWVDQFNRKERKNIFDVILMSEVKCLHGNNERLRLTW